MTKPTTMIEWLEDKVAIFNTYASAVSKDTQRRYYEGHVAGIREAITKAKELDAETCEWTFNEGWDSGCGDLWSGVERRELSDIGFEFCPFCGLSITEGEVIE